MDLTTLLGALVVALGLIGADTIRHAGSIQVEVSAAPQISGQVVDQATLESEFDSQLFAIATTPSVIVPPEIRAAKDQV